MLLEMADAIVSRIVISPESGSSCPKMSLKESIYRDRFARLDPNDHRHSSETDVIEKPRAKYDLESWLI
jgi:hypothetical protein